MDKSEKESVRLYNDLTAYDSKMAKIVMNKGCGDIDSHFMGFTLDYQHLAALIPKHFTVYDLGCCYAPQSWYFKGRTYIGVDLFVSPRHRFRLPGHKHYKADIMDWVDGTRTVLPGPTFAICHYVPHWGRYKPGCLNKIFHNLWCFYPEQSPDDRRRIAGIMRRSAQKKA